MALPDPSADPDRLRVLTLLRAFGWNATSFQILEPGLRYWFRDEGCVAYVDTGRAWVAAGAPLAADAEIGPVAEAFVHAARRAGRRAVFFATEQRFVEHSDYAALLIGEQPVWDPQRWAEGLARNA